MDLESDFLKALLPERSKILDLPLADYSLGHELILRRMGSPFLARGHKTDAELLPFLFENLFICSLPWREAVKASADPQLVSDFKVWQKRVEKSNFSEAIESLKKHIVAASRIPPFKRVERRGMKTFTPGTPLACVMIVKLMASLGMTLDAVLDTPLALTYWLYTAEKELDGVIKIQVPTPPKLKEAISALGLRRLKSSDFSGN